MDREQIIAFRLHQHHLLKRLPRSKLELAASSGLLNGLGGVAALALAARLEGFREADLEEATLKKKTLVELSGPRAAVWIVATHDFDVFTLGAAPASEDDVAKFVGSASKHLAENGIFPSLAVERVAAAARAALKGRALTQDEIHEEWRKNLPREFLYHCKGCASRHVHWMVAGAAGLRQAFCYGPLRDGDTAFVRPEDWLPKARRKLKGEEASRELARRYLRFYGPSRPAEFADWAGLSPRQGAEVWNSIGPELTEVKLKSKGAKPAWLLREDARALASPQPVKSVRLLPPRDPFLDLRDRETLLPDQKARLRVWRILGNPGVLLLDGEVLGTWRAKKKGKALEIDIERLAPFAKSAVSRIEEEAAVIAPLKGAETARVRID